MNALSERENRGPYHTARRSNSKSLTKNSAATSKRTTRILAKGRTSGMSNTPMDLSIRGTRSTNSIFAQSILERVIHSWEIIAIHKDAVGLDFFIRVLTEQPELLELFHFSDLTAADVLNKEKLANSSGLQRHASVVMNFVGRGVAGLSDLESLIPDLRALGKTHVRAGVSSKNYDMFFRHLMAAFAAELGTQWDHDTATAWTHIFQGMKAIMDQPETLNQTEPLVGFGLGVALSSAFVALISPLRLAGFTHSLPLGIIVMLDLLELVAASFFLVDLLSPTIIRNIKDEATRSTKTSSGLLSRTFDRVLSPFKYQIFRYVYSLHLERWIPWPRVDALILISYALQCTSQWYLWYKFSTCDGAPSLFYPSDVGISWLHAAGLLRIIAIARVSYFAHCAENTALLKNTTKVHWRNMAAVSNLLCTLVYVIHVSACFWCIVARVELGPGVTEASSTEFFPDTGILMGEASGALTSYMTAVYWAWVQLAGSGNIASSPTRPMEIGAALLVHMCGATLFAIATGHVVAILDSLTQKDNKIGDDLAKLRAFMTECQMPSDHQERIMRGYLTQKLMGSESSLDVPLLEEDVGRQLPVHFRQDLELRACMVALRRRNSLLENCSNEFVFALASALRGTMTLLPGDYFFKQGENVPRRFCMVTKGSLEVTAGDESVRLLERGCAIGVGWLVTATLQGMVTFPEPCELSDWLRKDGTAAVSIRAITECAIVFGLQSTLEIAALQRRFPQDFDTMDEQLDAAGATNGD